MPRRAAALVLVALLLAACSGGDDDDGDGAASDAARTSVPETSGDATGDGPLEWTECDDLECATLTVPLDYDDPDGETIELELARRPADGDAIGALVTNPGGPGAEGIPVVEAADFFFSEDLLENFDIVSWDPRGVGTSTPVDCVDNLDFFYATDKSPDDQAEIDEVFASAQELVDGCSERTGDLLPHLSTRSTVHDLESIRIALGEEKLTYIGFSYGTYIGALYADEYPDRVRAMVFDGAVDPALSFEELTLEQAQGFDGALEAFLDDCASRDCDFGGDDKRAAYDDVISSIDAETLPADIAGEERELGPGEADLGVARALYDGEQGWSELEQALLEAARGDGSALLSLSDSYTGRLPGGEYSNQTEAFYAIGCLDAPAPTGDEFVDVADSVGAVAPDFGFANAWLSVPCAVWPAAADGTPASVRAAGAPPIVVIGTSNDPATPLKWAESLADQLESGVLLVYEGEGHTAYARGNDCIDDAVDAYLIDLEPPESGTRC